MSLIQVTRYWIKFKSDKAPLAIKRKLVQTQNLHRPMKTSGDREFETGSIKHGRNPGAEADRNDARDCSGTELDFVLAVGRLI